MSYFSYSIEKITWPSLTFLSDKTICIIQDQTLSSKICFSLEKHVEMKKNISKFVKHVSVVRFNLNVSDDKIMDATRKTNVDKHTALYS